MVSAIENFTEQHSYVVCGHLSWIVVDSLSEYVQLLCCNLPDHTLIPFVKIVLDIVAITRQNEPTDSLLGLYIEEIMKWVQLRSANTDLCGKLMISFLVFYHIHGNIWCPHGTIYKSYWKIRC